MPLILLDRDGVINRDSDAFIKSLDEWRPLPGSLEAIARLSRAGWTVAVCTNQSGVARGLLSRSSLEHIHRHLREQVAGLGGRIDGIYVCPHGPDADCDCRKPRPGLLLQAARELGFRLDGVPMVGDAERDLEAARRVGARPVLVRTGKGEDTLARLGDAVEVFPDLAAVVDHLLAS